MKPWVLRLERCGTNAVPDRTTDGLAEFIAYESGGPKPTTPYGAFLLDAKRWLEWTINEWAGLYGTPEWPGWYCLEQDFKDDPQMLRMIRQKDWRI